MTLALEARDLTVRFGKALVLEGLSLSVEEGERVSIIGPNGAGKSTVLRAIAGLEPDALRSGTVDVHGTRLPAGSARDAVLGGITLVPQGRRLFGSLTVRENLELGAYLNRDRRRVESDLARWCSFFPEVGSRLDVRSGTLSGGLQQLVAVVRGLMAQPRVLMLDEPSMGIAPALIDRIGVQLRRVNEEFGLTLVLVEQNIDLAFSVAQRVVVLARGRVAHVAPPEELRDQEVLAGHFFGAS